MAAVALTQLRIVLVTTMGLLLTVIAGTVFDGVQRAIFVAPALVGLIALLVRRWRWPMRLGAATVSVVVGVVAVVVLAGGSIVDAGPGVLRGPRRLLTTEWPSPGDPTIIGAIALLVAAATALAADLAGRDRLHLAPLIPLVTALGALFAFAAPGRPRPWATVMFGVVAALVVLARPGDTLTSRRRMVLGERTLTISALAIAMVALATSTALAWTDRADPRHIEDAEVAAAIVDPVEAIVALRTVDPPISLFSLADRSTLIGQSLPARWRTAALDGYDGQRWVPRFTLRPIGGRLGFASPASPDRPPPIRYEIEFLTDDFELVPFPGRPISVSADVETDVDRVVVRLDEPPVPGRRVQAFSEIEPGAATAATALFAPRQVDDIASGFSELATILAGDGTVDERLRRIERTMRDEWQLDASAPGSGHQLALIERFVTDTRRGTEEQFVTAFVLLTRSLGFDARVATGFVVPPEELSNPLTIDSSHASAWPEVHLDGVGWLAFDPTPARVAVDDDEPPPPPEAQSPAAAQPPIAPPAETGDEGDDAVVDVRRDGGRWGSLGTWLTRSAVVGGVALFPVLVIAGAIVLTKLLRRRRRLQGADPAHRVRGAWANATDSLVDAGMTIAPAWTDDRIARHATALAPSAPHETRRLAAMASAMTFGATDDGWRLVGDAALTSTAIDTAIRAERTRWQRLRWRLSLRSLRRSTRSPVVD